MCGSLRLEGRKDKLLVRGQHIQCAELEIAPGAERDGGYLWDGHARSDGSASNKARDLKAQWLNKGFEPATIKGVESFTERTRLPDGSMKTTEIMLRQRAHIAALINRTTGVLVILTRPAKTDDEKSAHHRFPVYVRDRQHLVEAMERKFGK